MSGTSVVTTSEGVPIDREAVLRSLNLNPSDPKTQALLLVCERYGLDPVLKHMILIQGNPYVTRDGYLAIAHRSGVFDGMEVLEQGADETHYIAKVAVYRKDMRRPFTYIGRFPKSKNMAKEYGPEMAVKVAEVSALRRAFNVTGVASEDADYPEPPPFDPETGEITQAPALSSASAAQAPGPGVAQVEGGPAAALPAGAAESVEPAPTSPPPPPAFTEADETLAGPEWERKFRRACKDAELFEGQVEAIVWAGTNQRTVDPRSVYKQEIEAVRRAFHEIVDPVGAGA